MPSAKQYWLLQSFFCGGVDWNSWIIIGVGKDENKFIVICNWYWNLAFIRHFQIWMLLRNFSLIKRQKMPWHFQLSILNTFIFTISITDCHVILQVSLTLLRKNCNMSKFVWVMTVIEDVWLFECDINSLYGRFAFVVAGSYSHLPVKPHFQDLRLWLWGNNEPLPPRIRASKRSYVLMLVKTRKVGVTSLNIFLSFITCHQYSWKGI